MKKVENIVAKGEIFVRYEQFLLLSRWFQKSSAADVSIVGKGLIGKLFMMCTFSLQQYCVLTLVTCM